MKPDWILVADAAQACLFQEPGSPMNLLQVSHHRASRVRSRGLGDDERGRQQTDSRAGGSHDLDLSAVGPAEIERRVRQAIK